MPIAPAMPGSRHAPLALALWLIWTPPDALASSPVTALAASQDAGGALILPSAAPPLMLANVYAERLDPAAYWVSEKLDGVRAWWDGQRLISRGGHPIRAPAWFTLGFPAVPLDGELWMGYGAFERMSGLARRLKPDDEAWRSVRFMVFDLPGQDAPFGERLAALERLLTERSAAAASRILPVAQFRVADRAALMARLAAVERAGGEGLMLHRQDARYRAGRSNQLLKLKSFADAEARVLAHLPGQGKYRGQMGALLVEDARGRCFRIGSGFSDAQRRDPPPVGSLVSFRYRGLTANGVPRFAHFWRMYAPAVP